MNSIKNILKLGVVTAIIFIAFLATGATASEVPLAIEGNYADFFNGHKNRKYQPKRKHDDAEEADFHEDLGAYTLHYDDKTFSISKNSQAVWSTSADMPVLNAQRTNVDVAESRAIFTITPEVLQTCSQAEIEDVDRRNHNKVVVKGRFSDEGCEDLDFKIKFKLAQNGQLKFRATTNDQRFNLLTLNYTANDNEAFYGFGEQTTFLDLSGQVIPILTQEQGIGRGSQPISSIVNSFFPGAAGTPFTNYFSVPQYITTENRGLFLQNSEYSVFDLSQPEKVSVSVFSPVMKGRVIAGNSMLDVIEDYTQYSGRMPALPDWINEGAVVGLQGGTDRVRGIYDTLKAAGTPVAALWLQDWVGVRPTLGGAASQLWWNWELDQDHYPNFAELSNDLAEDGTKTMGYINPFLVDASEKGNVRRNLYQEALSKGYLVSDEQGNPIQTTITDFTAGIIDLTNNEANNWLQEVIKTELVGNGFSGWMADFGEALPMDVTLHNSETGFSYHNKYPVEWAKTNKKAIAEAGKTDETVFFMRAGYTKSPRHSTLFWMGDQTTTWDKYDGLQSAIVGLINGGFSGIALNHSDIGGYTSLAFPVSAEQAAQLPPEIIIEIDGQHYALLNRSPELLIRWMEANAFTSVFRTHEGLAPQINAQAYSDPALVSAFSLAANAYAALADYRRSLFEEAENKGYPVVRHPILHYPNDNYFRTMQPEVVQFMLGSGIMVAPVVVPASIAPSRPVHLPQGNWLDIWTGNVISAPEQGLTIMVTPSLGQPPVYFDTSNPAAMQAAQSLQQRLAPLLASGS